MSRRKSSSGSLVRREKDLEQLKKVTVMSKLVDRATYSDLGKALATDYFFLRQQLSPEQLDYLGRTRRLVDEEVLPVIGGYGERADFPWPRAGRRGELGLGGGGLTGCVCPPMDPFGAGLVQMELSRGDGSL